MVAPNGGQKLNSDLPNQKVSATESKLDFVHELLPNRVLFGAGCLADLGSELDKLELSRGLIVCTEGRIGQAESLRKIVGKRAIDILPKAKMHVPVETADLGVKTAQKINADCTIAIGGGSTVGLAKAIALKLGLPIIAVPTTFSGSEMTPIWGITEEGIKKTGRNAVVMPKLAIYDPDLISDLPISVAGPSGMNAIAHCIEALYSANPSPIVSLMALEGIHALSCSLPDLAIDKNARELALYGCWLSGICLGSVGMALHHKLCHVLGGAFALPHAELHTVLIPHVTAYNRPSVPAVLKKISIALNAKDGAKGLYDLARTIGAPRSLFELGMQKNQLEEAVMLAIRDPYYNPRPVAEEHIRTILTDAFEGREPRQYQIS